MNSVRKLLDTIYTNTSFASSISPTLFLTAVSSFQGAYLSLLVERKKPKTVIELGFGFGISALWIQSGEFCPQKHIIIDPYRKRSGNNGIFQFLKKRQGVHIVTSTSQVYLAAYNASRKRADMVVIDADERFDAVMTDMYFITHVLNRLGIVVIRNIWNPGVRKAIMFYLKNLPYEVIGVSKQQQWVMKNIPIVGELLLRYLVKPTDLCVLRLAAKDSRPWRHFRGF